MKNILIIIVIIVSLGYMGKILVDKYKNAKEISMKNLKKLPKENKIKD